ncbi:transcriptional regulator [Paenibacillus sp. 79R4]|uniref:transcriptional regulator n=1 Tax=Paenibacillus sp. 79R4 TaxID=2212847 RepID=UPI0015BC3124|nr:transcriptional regulator [Paenibacillus sp. 79R4]NWL86917.1 transcriptional regulator [Paenibacillus sp. 79R4]
MSRTTTISAILNDFMIQEGLNLRKFAEQVGINIGSLSYILNENRTLKMEQLDRITAVMGLPEGYFYNQYYDEVIAGSPPNWRKIKPFLYGCVEVGNLDLLLKTVQQLLDNLIYSPHLFEVAEDLNKNNKKEAAIILYENVAQSERHQHSERLALCQYRLFMCELENNQEKNYQAALQFELFVDRLGEYDQLEALKDLANTYRALSRWNKLEEIAERLKQIAQFLYQKGPKYDSDYKWHRPLFTYIAYANLLLGDVYEHKRDYEKTLQYIQLYNDLDWVKEQDEETVKWKEKFQDWAKMNTMVTKLAAGDASVLADYLAYMESNHDEVLLSLLNIIEFANRYHFNIDDILQRFDIPSLIIKHKSLNKVYTRQIIGGHIARFNNELSSYYLNKGGYRDGLNYLLNTLNKSVFISEKHCIFRLLGQYHFSYNDQHSGMKIISTNAQETSS